MSEFRKYRLVTKLFDKYGASWQPQRLLQYCVGPSPIGSEHKQGFTELSGEAWWPLLVQVQAISPRVAFNVMSFLSGLASSHAGFTDITIQPIPSNFDPKHDGETRRPSHSQTDYAHQAGFRNLVPTPPLDDLGLTVGEADQVGHQESIYSLKQFTNSYEWCAGNLPPALQELFIIEDFFDLVLGVSGRFLAWDRSEGASLLVDETLSPHLVESIKPLITIVQSLKTIELFIVQKSHSTGRVLGAFIAATQRYITDFRDVVAQLEKSFASGSIRLQIAKVHVVPFEKHLGLLASFVTELEQSHASGGALLRRLEYLADRFSGDRSCRSFVENITAQSALPFVHMLRSWLEAGEVDDPCNEFMVGLKRPNDTANCECPFSVFAVVEENVPLVLKARTRKLAQLGSYFVILRMARDVFQYKPSIPSMPDLLFLNQRKIFQIIDSSFDRLSSLIMTRVMQGRHLLDRLEICRGFYFLEKADIFGTFLDLCGAELSKPASSAIWEKVVACWDSAVDAYVPEMEICAIRAIKESLGLTQQLQRIIGADTNLEARSHEGEDYAPQCVEMVCLEANFEFPYNILLNKENLSKYNILFRFLLRLVFLHSAMAQMKPQKLDKQFCLLRRQMLVFLESLHQYLVNDVIQSRWKLLSEAISGCRGLEEILSLHVEFLDSCLRQSMLTNGKLLKILNILFCYCSRAIELGRAGLGDSNTLDRVASILASFERDMLSFMEALQYFSSRDYDYHLGALFSRMDINSSYCRLPAINYS